MSQVTKFTLGSSFAAEDIDDEDSDDDGIPDDVDTDDDNDGILDDGIHLSGS